VEPYKTRTRRNHKERNWIRHTLRKANENSLLRQALVHQQVEERKRGKPSTAREEE
jgi:stalled ribosome alternative rescue factor ArfA